MKQESGKKIIPLLATMAVTLLAGQQLIGNGDLPETVMLRPTVGATAAVPILVELFTSQGCSSCPPADRLLSRLAASGKVGEAAIIPLSYHVDYWNYIGWTDPFSSAEWSQRQSSYAHSFDSGRVYTPQVVVNGRRDCVGSNEKCVSEEIERAAREGAAGRLKLELGPGADAGRLNLEIEALVAAAAAGEVLRSGATWSVMVAVFENGLETPVSRGENGGRTLRNSHVVRTLTEAFSLPAHPGARHSGQLRIELDNEWHRQRLGIAVFLQDPVSRHIHGAAVRYLSQRPS